jgi:hypothetical protein
VSRAKAPAPLPDMDDEELRQRLEPLAATLPTRQARAVVRPEPAVAPQPRKPPRRGIEFLLPETVVTEIKTRAAQRGISATTLLLELLRDAGYSVTDADFVDMRRLPRKIG